MPNQPSSSVADQDTIHSKTARLACWLTGSGIRRSPTTAASLLKMARERNAVEKAQAEWNKRKQAALNVHVEQWGDMGLIGTIEDAAAIGPRPKGTALLRWHREHGEGGEGEGRGRQRGQGTSVSGGGRSTGEGATAPEPAGQHTVEIGSAIAAGFESDPRSQRQDDEAQRHTAPADNDDDVNVAPGRGGGASSRVIAGRRNSF